MQVNKRGGITATLLDTLLCVETDNNPSQGLFISNPTAVSSSDMAVLRNLNPNVNAFQVGRGQAALSGDERRRECRGEGVGSEVKAREDQRRQGKEGSICRARGSGGNH